MQIFQYPIAFIGFAGLIILGYGHYKFPKPDPEKRYAGDAAQEAYVKAMNANADKRAPYAITGIILVTIAVVAIVLLLKVAS